jgi:hypothetical protein
MEKKQSSIDWLVEMVSKMGYVSVEILEQAKAMHKEEVTDAYIDGHSTWGVSRNAEQYYNEIFGG